MFFGAKMRYAISNQHLLYFKLATDIIKTE